MIGAGELVLLLHHRDELLRDRSVVAAVERRSVGRPDRGVTGELGVGDITRGRCGNAQHALGNAHLERLLSFAGQRIRLSAEGEDLRIGSLYLEQVRAEVEVGLLHLRFVDWDGLVELLHVILELLDEGDAGAVGRVQVGNVLSDVLAQVLAVGARVVTLGHRHAKDPFAALLGDRRVGRHRYQLRHLFLRRHVGNRHRDRTAGGANDQVDLVLVDEPVDVGDALIGFALVVEQDHFDLRAVDAALGVDRLDRALRDIPVRDAGFDQHPQRDTDADGLVLRRGRACGQEQAQQRHVPST